jgi:hypothetical protein
VKFVDTVIAAPVMFVSTQTVLPLFAVDPSALTRAVRVLTDESQVIPGVDGIGRAVGPPVLIATTPPMPTTAAAATAMKRPANVDPGNVPPLLGYLERVAAHVEHHGLRRPSDGTVLYEWLAPADEAVMPTVNVEESPDFQHYVDGRLVMTYTR